MSKRDRIAYVVSCIALLFMGLVSLEEGPAALLIGLPVLFYWLYRYFNKDISFLDQDKELTNGVGDQLPAI